MNKNKEGKPYLYPDSFILAIGCIRCYFHLPYRQTEGIIKVAGRRILPNHPCYGQICKRINKLNIDDSNGEINESEDVTIAIDSTGIKVTNRGQWLRDKWFVKKKGYLKIHVAVNVKTKEILALEVTDEKVYDGKVMRKLVKHILDNGGEKKVRIKSVLSDGAYDSNENFRFLNDKGIEPAIKVRKNSIVSSKSNRMRNREVIQQTKDFLRWKKKERYGQRWIAETAFSSIKRMFGEHASASKFQNMVREMMLKVSLYNLFTRLA
jgi:transposase